LARSGLLITFEGPEGAGKTTQCGRLASYLAERGCAVRRYAEPGGTRISDQIRALLLAVEHSEMAPRAEAFLFLAARAQLVAQEIRPALEQGQLVICDRYTDSTLAYQGASTGLPAEELQPLNDFATGGLTPDLTILLDVDVETGLKRQGDWNRMEGRGLDYHRRVRERYLALAREDPRRIVVVDARQPCDQVAREICARVDRLIR
jgi:dTMP kinase